MRARAVFLRLLGALSIIFGVFFASFFIAVTMRHSAAGNSRQDLPDALAQTTDAQTTESGESNLTLPLVEVLDIVSTNASGVPTTTPQVTDPESPPETEAPPRPRPILPELDPAFATIAGELGETLTIPVRLPAVLDDSTEPWTSKIGLLDDDGYTIHLDLADDRVSTFTARRSQQRVPQLPAGTPVPLPNGLSGVLSDSSCGAGCNNPFITWVEDGVRYSVGSRVASGAAVLDLAWRSIDAALPTPSGPEVCGLGAPKHDGQVARTITTEVDGDRSMHWVAVCSALGLDVEIIDAPGDLRWQDVDADGTHDAVVRYEDGSATIFAIDTNRPRSFIDARTGGRLRVVNLRCAFAPGGRIAIDAASNERLDFVTASTVRRIADDALSETSHVDC